MATFRIDESVSSSACARHDLNSLQLDGEVFLTCWRTARRGAAPGPSGIICWLFVLRPRERDGFQVAGCRLLQSWLSGSLTKWLKVSTWDGWQHWAKPDGGVGRGSWLETSSERLVARTIAKQFAKNEGGLWVRAHHAGSRWPSQRHGNDSRWGRGARLVPRSCSVGRLLEKKTEIRPSLLHVVPQWGRGTGRPPHANALLIEWAHWWDQLLAALTTSLICIPERVRAVVDVKRSFQVTHTHHSERQLQQVISQASTTNVWWTTFRLPVFSPPGGSRPLLSRFPFSMVFTIALSLARCPTLQDAAPCFRQDSQYECGRPHDTLSVPFLFRPMAWARSIHIDTGTANQRYWHDLQQKHYRPSPLHAFMRDLCPLCGRWLHLEDLINPVFHCPRKIPITDTWKMLLLLLHIYVGRDVLQPPEIQRGCVWIGTQVSIFLKAVFDVSPGIQEGLLDLRFLHKLPGKENTTSLVDTWEETTSCAYNKFMGKPSFSRLFRYWLRDFGCMVHSYQAMQVQEARPYALIKTSCLMMLL